MQRYELIQLTRLIGGHFAALDTVTNKVIGEDWRLDRGRATDHVKELNKANQKEDRMT